MTTLCDIAFQRIQGLLEAYFVYPGSGGHLVKVNYAIVSIFIMYSITWIGPNINFAFLYIHFGSAVAQW